MSQLCTRAVPGEAVQIVPYRMKAPLIGNDFDRLMCDVLAQPQQGYLLQYFLQQTDMDVVHCPRLKIRFVAERP